jgi:hypothetical protein
VFGVGGADYAAVRIKSKRMNYDLFIPFGDIWAAAVDKLNCISI